MGGLHVLGCFRTKIDGPGIIANGLHNGHLAVFARHVLHFRENRLRIAGAVGVAHAHNMRRNQDNDFIILLLIGMPLEQGAKERNAGEKRYLPDGVGNFAINQAVDGDGLAVSEIDPGARRTDEETGQADLVASRSDSLPGKLIGQCQLGRDVQPDQAVIIDIFHRAV